MAALPRVAVVNNLQGYAAGRTVHRTGYRASVDGALVRSGPVGCNKSKVHIPVRSGVKVLVWPGSVR